MLFSNGVYRGHVVRIENNAQPSTFRDKVWTAERFAGVLYVDYCPMNVGNDPRFVVVCPD